MTAVVYVVVYLGLLAFVAGCVARAIMYARLPAHLRWELYPVPHEAPERVRHGGSYFEDGDWWLRRRHVSLAGQLRFMVPEMVFLKGLREFNRRLWYRSFPFHFGLYLLAVSLALLAAHAMTARVAPAPAGDAVGTVLGFGWRVSGAVGWVLALAGAAGLLHRRLSDPALRGYTAPGDIFNLACFIVTLGILGAGVVEARSAGLGVLAVAQAFLAFDAGLRLPALLGSGLVLGGLLVAYIPMTHMSHFIAKYFTYHSIRWDDRPVGTDRALQVRLAEYLTYRPTWAAKHLGADGTKTWTEIVASDPSEGAP